MTSVTLLGTGEMGSALARAALAAGFRTIVWNRATARTCALREAGARVATSVGDAVVGADLLVVCLFDHASVHDVLDPVTHLLRGRHVINLTTTTPDGARELARWAAGAGAGYLDGAIMATPEMIGTSSSTVFYSGSRELYDAHRALLETWRGTEYFGTDAGMASLYDLALLAAMYLMFGGFFQGAAMVAGAGVTATEFAARAMPWLQAMAPAVTEYAAVIDSGNYGMPGQQSLSFSDLNDIVTAARCVGVSTALVDALQQLIRRQIEAGFAEHGFARVFESIKENAA
ncbi:NAD(P)-binding domain-containing protein [Mycobacterium sp. ITM-2016-00317]|uniref:NAD(P)-dependent oxidoreductase n=1 Tax=Mycobacterium sp. ITM-2016-00317 TaxID=2099694 RepID=UPI00287F80A1|nr:NAD(P)-binding domain-containing protein [Mycobacterium sp. ITM-2016-00317]WNG87300.1 NAD(P)-binding domain-containing protein [Mycobacterium sp. ITM-2016-00317]